MSILALSECSDMKKKQTIKLRFQINFAANLERTLLIYPFLRKNISQNKTSKDTYEEKTHFHVSNVPTTANWEVILA